MSADRDYLAAGLALGGLSDSELAEAQALADADPEFRAEVAAYADVMADAAESDEPVDVSAATRDAILAIPSTHSQQRSADAEPTADGSESEASAVAGASDETLREVEPVFLARHRKSRRRSWLPYAAAAAALIVAAGSGVTVWQQAQRQNQLEEDLTTAQQQLDDSTRLMQAGDLHTSTDELPEGGTVTVSSSESEQLIRISPDGVGRAPEGKSMQMWVIGDDGPESAGLMTGESTTIADHTFTDGSVFGITIEPEGGSDQPTTDPVVAISL